MLCCVVLYCVVLCCVVLCCVVVCCAVLCCYVVLSCLVLVSSPCFSLVSSVLSCVVLCCVVVCCVVLCCVVLSCRVVSCRVVSCDALVVLCCGGLAFSFVIVFGMLCGVVLFFVFPRLVCDSSCRCFAHSFSCLGIVVVLPTVVILRCRCLVLPALLT